MEPFRPSIPIQKPVIPSTTTQNTDTEHTQNEVIEATAVVQDGEDGLPLSENEARARDSMLYRLGPWDFDHFQQRIPNNVSAILKSVNSSTEATINRLG